MQKSLPCTFREQGGFIQEKNWSEEIHDEVLARLLKLNRDRAAEEIHGETKRRKEPATPTTKVSKTPQTSTISRLDI